MGGGMGGWGEGGNRRQEGGAANVQQEILCSHAVFILINVFTVHT